MLLVTGATAFGVVGLLLAVMAPVRSCKVPVVETVPNGSTNVNGATVATVLDTCMDQLIISPSFGCRASNYTLMMIWFVDVLRTTLQDNVPLRTGRVLGMYSSPRFKLNS